MRKYTLLLLFFYSCIQLVRAQTEPRLDSMPGYQPTIMVIPFAKQGEDWRQQLEQDKVMLTAVTAVREGFAAAGYSTVDLRARLRQLANDQTIEWGNLTSVKQEVIELSGADIYVEVEPIINESYNGNTGGLIMTAYDAVSGVSLANHTSHSPSFYTKQYERLVQRAAEEGLPEFIPQITSSFHDMLISFAIEKSSSVSYVTTNSVISLPPSRIGQSNNICTPSFASTVASNDKGGLGTWSIGVAT